MSPTQRASRPWSQRSPTAAGGSSSGPRVATSWSGLVAQDVQDALLDTNGRWPLCRACDVLEPHALYVHPDLGGPDPAWVCEHAGIAVAPIGEL